MLLNLDQNGRRHRHRPRIAGKPVNLDVLKRPILEHDAVKPSVRKPVRTQRLKRCRPSNDQAQRRILLDDEETQFRRLHAGPVETRTAGQKRA